MRKGILILVVLVMMAALAARRWPEDSPLLPGEVVVSDLLQPRGISFGPDGGLIIVEGGEGGDLVAMETRQGPLTVGMAWSVSSVSEDGAKTPLLLLPSVNTGVEALSAYRAYWHDDLRWVVMSGGAPDQPPWNPLSATVLQLDPTGRILKT